MRSFVLIRKIEEVKMRKKMRFELFLEADPSVQEQSKRALTNKFGASLTPVCETEGHEESSVLHRFYDITLKVEAEKVWDVARDLASVDGVLEVDPDIPQRAHLESLLVSIEHEGEERLAAATVEEDNPAEGWYHEQTRFPQAIAYAIEQAKANQGRYKGGESGIKVGQIDTGYTDHPEVVKIKKEAGYNFVSPPWWIRWLRHGWRHKAKDPIINFIPFSWASHGTSSASVIMGTNTDQVNIIPGNEDRINGVFPYVDLIPYRIANSVISFDNNMARAGAQAMQDGCQVVTVSHGSLIKSKMLETVVAECYEKGIMWFGASGTHVIKLKKLLAFPAKLRHTIAVAASTVKGERWEWTHGGPRVDICAPGYRIYRPFARRRGFRGWFGRVQYSYGWSDGSTFSTPITAAAAALWLAHHGEDKLNDAYPEPWQRVEAFRAVLKSSASPHSDPVEHTKYYGAGLLNVEDLIKSPLPDAGTLQHVGRPSVQVEAVAKSSVERVTAKELTYLTGFAKVETEDQKGDELYHYVKARSSDTARAVIEHIVQEEAPAAEAVESIQEENPKSEALKAYVKRGLEI